MPPSFCLGVLLLVSSLQALPQPPPPPPSATPAQQANAASATKDNSATSGDQNNQPTGAKGSTLIGCLVGPDKDGKFIVRSMTHRMGVQVVGPNDLKNDSGSKVKLTGQWQPLPPDQQQVASPSSGNSQQPEGKPETHRFQATDVEVLAQKCTSPSESTPVSKNKRQKPTTYNAPSSDDSK